MRASVVREIPLVLSLEYEGAGPNDSQPSQDILTMVQECLFSCMHAPRVSTLWHTCLSHFFNCVVSSWHQQREKKLAVHTNGHFSAHLRIEEVSKNHTGRNFAIRVKPDLAHNPLLVLFGTGLLLPTPNHHVVHPHIVLAVC